MTVKMIREWLVNCIDSFVINRSILTFSSVSTQLFLKNETVHLSYKRFNPSISTVQESFEVLKYIHEFLCCGQKKAEKNLHHRSPCMVWEWGLKNLPMNKFSLCLKKAAIKHVSSCLAVTSGLLEVKWSIQHFDQVCYK